MDDLEPVVVPRWVLARAVQCIARAESQGAYDGCVVPSIGRLTLQTLRGYVETSEVPATPSQKN